MKTTLLTTALLIGFAGMASAGCFGMEKTETTAEATYTPIPEAEPTDVADSPLILPEGADEETSEG